MPTFSHSLEHSLHRALALASERHHEYATLEHLLLALVDDPDAAGAMGACNVDIDKLRRNLTAYVESELDNLVTDASEDSKPTAGVLRVIQRAVIHVQASGREEVTGANVLVAIFAERESHATYFLQEQKITRYDVVNEDEQLLQFFAYEYLPEHQQEHSKPFGDLARRLVETLPRNPERTMALRRLLEARDCAVRAKLFK